MPQFLQVLRTGRNNNKRKMSRYFCPLPQLILVLGFFSYSNGLQVLNTSTIPVNGTDGSYTGFQNFTQRYIAGSTNITFICPGQNGAAAIETGYDILKICGPHPELSMIADSNVDYAEIVICFSETTSHVSHKHALMTFIIRGYAKDTIWTPADVSMVIDNNDLPCGSGYLVAELRNNGAVVATEYERAIRICDNSDIDVSLHIESTMKMGMVPHLYTGVFPDDLLTQISNYLTIGKAVLHNNGSKTLPNATMETPHMVAVYLQGPQPIMLDYAEKCMVPTYKISDQLIGQIVIRDAIRSGEEFDLVPHFHGHYMPTKSAVCGDANLVIFYDPLKIDNDDDECNNFATIPVHVTCSNHDQMEDCMMCPNPMEMSTWAMFGNRTFYEYDDNDGEWKGHSLGMMMDEETKMNLVHAGMTQLMQRHLSELYSEEESGLCMFVRRFHRDALKILDEMKVPDARIGADLETKIKEIIETMEAYKDINPAMQSLVKWEVMEMDPVNKSLINGTHTALTIIQGIHMGMTQLHFVGQPFPANSTRVMLGPMLKGLAQLHYAAEMHPMFAGMYGGEMLKYAQVVRLVAHYMHHHNLIPGKVANSLMKITNFIMNKYTQPMANDTGSNAGNTPSMMLCPFEKQIDFVSKVLLTMAKGWDGEEMRHTRENAALGICRANLLRVFLLRGGYKLVRKRYVHKVLMEKGMKPDDLMSIPKQCRLHPLQPFDISLEHFFVNDDGKIMKADMSILQETMTYKVVATCHCKDNCADHGSSGSTSTNHGMGDHTGMWTTSPPSWNNGMWGTTLPSWMAPSPINIWNNHQSSPPPI